MPEQELVVTVESRNSRELGLLRELDTLAEWIVEEIQLCNRISESSSSDLSSLGSMIASMRTGLSIAFIDNEPSRTDPTGDDPSYDYYWETKWDVTRLALIRALSK